MSEPIQRDHTIAPVNGAKSAASEPAPPAYFLSLSVENVRCFRQKQTLDLSNGAERPARWTLILGENGVGKTTLLQLLALMQPVDVGNNFGLQYFYNVFMNSTLKGIEYQGALLQLENEQTPTIDCSVQCGAKLESQASIVVVEYGVSVNGFVGDLHNHINPVVRDLLCYGYGASRRMGTTALSDAPDADTSASLFSDQVELINAEEWLLQADYAASRAKGVERARAEKRFEQVKQILLKLLPDVTDLRIKEAAPSAMQMRVEMKTPYGWVPLQGLSLGYRTLLTWMVDFASRLFTRYPDSKNPLAEPAVVLVDEIDLHLHPRWQRTLIQFLSDTFPNTQFIATAHSPLVVQAAGDANIVLLRREGDHVIIDNDVEKIKNWRVDQILTSDLFGLESARPPQLDAMLQERDRLLAKSRLTKADKEKLTQLEQAIGELPTGETPADIEAMDVIRRAAALLNKS